MMIFSYSYHMDRRSYLESITHVPRLVLAETCSIDLTDLIDVFHRR